MRIALKYGLIFAASWIALKMIFFMGGIFQDDIMITGLLNNLFLLLAISLGIYFEKKKEGFGEGNALSDIKHGLIAGAPYTLIIAIFLFFYYRDVNPEYIETKVSERYDMMYDYLSDDANLAAFRETSEEYEVMKREEILVKYKVDIRANLNPKATMLLSLLGMLVLSFTYSIFVTVIYRKVMLRNFYK